MTHRVAVFIDYENVHRTGHGRFAQLGENLYDTVVNPLLLAQLIVDRRSLPCELVRVAVFRGRPVPQHQPKPASANDIQAQAWAADARVSVTCRDLKYDFAADGTFTVREKGIDVALAVALTEGALDDTFDSAVVFSGDTDLLPALELVFNRQSARVEIAK